LTWRLRFADSTLGYFTHHSPDFVNYKGQSLDASQQVEAFAQAQSIGMCSRRG
jgi:sodium/potassium-transporting ATPase subunit alpha